VGRAFAAYTKQLLAGSSAGGKHLSFSMTSAAVRKMVRTVNRWSPHPSTITGVLMHRLFLAEPMFKQLTGAKSCQFIYDRGAKCVTGEVEYH
jgi:hypothetical protein